MFFSLLFITSRRLCRQPSTPIADGRGRVFQYVSHVPRFAAFSRHVRTTCEKQYVCALRRRNRRKKHRTVPGGALCVQFVIICEFFFCCHRLYRGHILVCYRTPTSGVTSCTALMSLFERKNTYTLCVCV